MIADARRANPVNWLLGIAAVTFLSWQAPTLAGPVGQLDADGAAAFPQMMFLRIADEITEQTTTVETRADGVVQWSPTALIVVDFLKSQAESPNSYEFAIRYEVGMQSKIVRVHSGYDERAIEQADYAAICSATVLYRNGAYELPTVVCEPPDHYRRLTDTLPLDPLRNGVL